MDSGGPVPVSSTIMSNENEELSSSDAGVSSPFSSSSATSKTARPRPLFSSKRATSDQTPRTESNSLETSFVHRRSTNFRHTRSMDGGSYHGSTTVGFGAVLAAARFSKQIGKRLSAFSDPGHRKDRDNNNDDSSQKKQSPIVQDPYQYLQKVVTQQSSPFLSQFMDSPIPAPSMARNALLVGKLVQEGDFHNLSEVYGFKSRNPNEKQHHYGLKFISPQILYPTTAINNKNNDEHADHNRRTQQQQQQHQQRQLEKAVLRLVLEGLYLGHLSHPHILKLRGVAMGGMASDPEASFLLTDRITETLDQRLETWKTLAEARAKEERKRQRRIQYPPLAPPTNIVAPGQNSLEVLLRDRTIRNYPEDLIVLKTNYALQILEALEYLHTRGIVVRELRPESIGFSPYPYHHTVQLCDLSSCREVPRDGNPIDPEQIGDRPSMLSTSSLSNNSNHSDHKRFELMSARSHVTVRRYMAPEVFGDVGYTTKADLYSWAMIFCEMVTETKPYTSRQLMRDWGKITKGELRPKLQKYQFPRTIKAIIEQTWQANVSQRASAKQVGRSLRIVLYMLEGQGLPWNVNHDDSIDLVQTTVETTTTPNRRMARQKTYTPQAMRQSVNNSKDGSAIKELHSEVWKETLTLPQRGGKYKRLESKDRIGWGNVWDPHVGFHSEMDKRSLARTLKNHRQEVFQKRYKSKEKQIKV